MPKFAANLTMLFTEAPFLDRFALAREAGFRFVEFLLPYGYSAKELKARLDANSLTQVLFNLPCGDWPGGDRGIAANPGRIDEFRIGVSRAIEYALELNVPRLNCLAGKRNPKYSVEEHWAALVQNVRFAAEALNRHGLTLVVEPINHFDIPGFFINRTEQALKLIEEVQAGNVLIQYDVYHAQREEGEVVATLRKSMPKIGHIQVADNPGRNQPDTGEINYPFVLKEIDALGYQGYVGLEYVPRPDSKASFGWITKFGYTL